MKFTKKFIIILIAIIACAGLVGCSLDPVYYSKREVLNYAQKIFGENIQLIEELEYKDEQEENSLMYEYVFQDDNGLEFSVYNHSSRTYFTSNETKFYQKNIENDYIAKMVSSKEKELLLHLDNSSFSYRFEEGSITLYLESYLDLEKASTLLAEIDSLLSFEYNLDAWNEYPYNDSHRYLIALKIKPNSGEYASSEDWHDDSGLFLIQAAMSYDADTRTSAEDYFMSTEKSFVDKVRTYNETDYILPEDLLHKYPE